MFGMTLDKVFDPMETFKTKSPKYLRTCTQGNQLPLSFYEFLLQCLALRFEGLSARGIVTCDPLVKSFCPKPKKRIGSVD